MQIKCKLIRQGGSVVELDGVQYHFQPNAQGDHVAEVEDEAHIDILLGIPEAYQEYQSEPAAQGDLLAGGDTTAKAAKGSRTAKKTAGETPTNTNDAADTGDKKPE